MPIAIIAGHVDELSIRAATAELASTGCTCLITEHT
jgi:hypothetical protein